jgi:hypothetical protein
MGNRIAKVSTAPPSEWQEGNGVLAAIPADEQGAEQLPEPPQREAEAEVLTYSKTHKRRVAVRFNTHRFKHAVDGKHWRWMAYYAEWEPEAPPADLLEGYEE